MTGLGTPVANLLVSDLVAYQSGTFVASGPTVGALQNTTLTDTGASGSGTTNVFSVFDSVIDAGNGLGSGHDAVGNSGMTTPLAPAPAPAAANQAPSTGFFLQTGHGQGPGTVTNPGSFGAMPISPSEVTVIATTTSLGSRQPAGPTVRPGVKTRSSYEQVAVSQRIDHDSALGVIPKRFHARQMADSVLDELALDAVWSRGPIADETGGLPVLWVPGITETQAGQRQARSADPGFNPVPAGNSAGFTARLAAILVAVGWWGGGARVVAARNPRAGVPSQKRKAQTPGGRTDA